MGPLETQGERMISYKGLETKEGITVHPYVCQGPLLITRFFLSFASKGIRQLRKWGQGLA